MALERTHACPVCETDRTFFRSASTFLHLGQKVKWTCDECDYQFVQVGEIDTATSG